jgi:hypothetical protein
VVNRSGPNLPVNMNKRKRASNCYKLVNTSPIVIDSHVSKSRDAADRSFPYFGTMKTELGQFRFASPIIDLANVNTPFD